MNNQEKQFLSKKAEVINFNEKQIDALIRKTEAEKVRLMLEMDKLMPDFNKAQDEFNFWKGEVDKVKEVLEFETGVLEQLIRHKTNNGSSTIKVYHNLSNTTHKVQKKERNLRWLQKIKEILFREKRFIQINSIIQMVGTENPEYAQTLKKYTPNHIYQNILRAAHSSTKNGNSLVVIGEKVGLPTWVDSKGHPLPTYLKEFMYNETPQMTKVV
jgi:hypothetical protein